MSGLPPRLRKVLGTPVGKPVMVVLGLFVAWQVYTGLYPLDSFYAEDYHEVVGQAIPADADIIAKGASFPDTHGDYCSFSRIRVTADTYARLLVTIRASKNFELNSSRFISVTHEAETSIAKLPVTATFTRSDTAIDHYLSIRFLAGEPLIEIHRCST